jgi:hypothetical protein
MQRLCGRPGCSDVASVVYGMRAEDLVFWIDRLPDPLDEGAAVLCRRHADSMVVPRGWTLDDLRDPDLHLFRPPLPAPTARTRAARPPRERAVGEQLRLDAEPRADDAASEIALEVEAEAVIDTPVASQTEPDPDVGPWTPSFDEADDLDGLLSARSPLLSRAFRTADRPAE